MRNEIYNCVLNILCVGNVSAHQYRSQLAMLSLTAVLSAGCNSKTVEEVPMKVDGEAAIPTRLPTSAEMFKVTAPDYKLSPAVKSECFGRLAFEVRKEVEWPTYFLWQYPDVLFNRSFSPKVADPGDTMRFGSTHIAVIGSVNGVEKEKVFQSTPAALEAHLLNRMKSTRAFVDDLKKKGGGTGAAVKEIKEAEEWIKGWEESIRENRVKFEPFDPGLPASQGYWTSTTEANDETDRYSVLRAYLTRGEHIYVFESSVEMKTPSDKEAHKHDFSNMLAKFRTRAANEIPAEPGVCVPFGFIADDGRTIVEFKQTLRFPDAPGVLYTIETGTVHLRRLKATPLLAAAHASINPPSATEKNETRPVVTQRIGPHLVKMGGLSASQGGVVLKTGSGGEKYDIYSVFTGSGGWLGTAVLPYILVEMHSVSKEQAAELKHNPPPFEQSKDRLDVLLKSMRWRATDPPMLEFERK
jgi:hypothetical protein